MNFSLNKTKKDELSMNETSKFKLFQDSSEMKEKFCPFCEEELEETMENDRLYCISCQRTIKICDAKSKQSVKKFTFE